MKSYDDILKDTSDDELEDILMSDTEELDDILDDSSDEDISYGDMFDERSAKSRDRSKSGNAKRTSDRYKSGNGNRDRRPKKSGNRSRNGNRSKIVMTIIAAAALCVAAVLCIVIIKYMPTSSKMSGYDYFKVQSSDTSEMVIVDGEMYSDAGVKTGDGVYLPYDFVTQNINVRFYKDAEADAILYTDSTKVYTFKADSTSYTDSNGGASQADVPVVKSIDGQIYLNLDFVVKYTNVTCVYTNSPDRAVITTCGEEREVVTAKKKTPVRYRAGIKSKVLEEVGNGEKLYYVSTVDEDWMEVETSTGFTGYIKSSSVSDVTNEVTADTFVENYNNISKNYKINMGWFQVAGTAGNATIDSTLNDVGGINTISPTWYVISGTDGSATSYASADFVSNMHARGIEVWPLVNDFSTDVDYAALFASRTARTKLISQLISDAKKYGYDGLNLDFESVKSAYAKDFLQFVRELSIECEKNNIVLSSDCYKPESFNACYNLKEQASFVDYVILMGYDEHYSGSDAGSVASIGFVREGIEDALKQVPADQLINGIPFYTRIWTVSSSGTTSRAVSMQTAIDDMNNNGAISLWDDESGQYVCSYDKNGATVRIWFEEEKSVEEKMKVIKENNLAGVAEWKLGLERSGVWSVIGKYLN